MPPILPRPQLRSMYRSAPLAVALILGLTLGIHEGATAEPAANTLRVLTYNIHHGEGVDGKLDLQRIAKVIRESQADLVALQEVDVRVKRSGFRDQAFELSQMTGLKMAFGGNIELQGGRYGNAILSRYPILESQNTRLPNVDNGEQRGVLSARIQVPGNRPPLRFLATHFDHRREERERVLSAQAVNQIADRDPRQATLLAGDLNAISDSRPLVELFKLWTNTTIEPLATIPVGAPQRQIDFILYRPASEFRVLEVKVLDEAIASDHRAFLAIVERLP